MANAIITIKIMPKDPSIDLKKIEDEAQSLLNTLVGEGDRKVEIEPIAFGLKAINLTFVVDEKKGSADPIAEQISRIEGVQSAEVTDVRRAIG
ncbi:MAG: elongation factor 1-beta [Nanoarchaeota archaeon]